MACVTLDSSYSLQECLLRNLPFVKKKRKVSSVGERRNRGRAWMRGHYVALAKSDHSATSKIDAPVEILVAPFPVDRFN